MFCDSHCHLFSEYYDNMDEIINNALINNVDKLITAACDTKTSLETLEVIDKYDNVYGCIGLHPEEVDDNFDFNIFNNLPKKVVALGEIGLDYYYTKDNKEKQKEIFEKQLKLAEELNLPVVVHSREATQDTINILKEYNVKGVIHSFSGSLETAKIKSTKRYDANTLNWPGLFRIKVIDSSMIAEISFVPAYLRRSTRGSFAFESRRSRLLDWRSSELIILFCFSVLCSELPPSSRICFASSVISMQKS